MRRLLLRVRLIACRRSSGGRPATPSAAAILSTLPARRASSEDPGSALWDL
jgi:hypothetical protein